MTNKLQGIKDNLLSIFCIARGYQTHLLQDKSVGDMHVIKEEAKQALAALNSYIEDQEAKKVLVTIDHNFHPPKLIFSNKQTELDK